MNSTVAKRIKLEDELPDVSTKTQCHNLQAKKTPDIPHIKLKRGLSPAPSHVSMKSDRSMDPPGNFLGGATAHMTSIKLKRGGSPAPSHVSMKSDRSMDPPGNFMGGIRQDSVKFKRGVSPAPSHVSMKSDRSMDPPGNFMGGTTDQKHSPGREDMTSDLSRTLLTEDHFRCSVCTEVLKHPVSIPCGHSYCRQCITSHWAQPNHAGHYACPQCSHTYSSCPELYTNSALAVVVQKLQHFSPASPAQCYAGPGDVACDFCTEKKLRAVKFCLTCPTSFCEPHGRQHYTDPKLRGHTLVGICLKHHRALDIFCWTDQIHVCRLCMEDEHKHHDTRGIQLKQECANVRHGKPETDCMNNIAMKTWNSDPTAKNTQLKNKNLDIVAQNMAVEEENLELIAKNTKLQGVNLELIAKNTEMKAANGQQTARNTQLKLQYSELRRKNDELEIDTSKLKDQIPTLKNRNSDLEIENCRLMETNDKLLKKNSNLKVQYTQLKIKGSNMAKRNSILRKYIIQKQAENSNTLIQKKKLETKKSDLLTEKTELEINISKLRKRHFWIRKCNSELQTDNLDLFAEKVELERVNLNLRYINAFLVEETSRLRQENTELEEEPGLREKNTILKSHLSKQKTHNAMLTKKCTMLKRLVNSVIIGRPGLPANVTLDPDTAHCQFTISDDGKRMRYGRNDSESIPDNPQRFDWLSFVLGQEGFSSGRHFWQVEVNESWIIGVTKESAPRRGLFTAKAQKGYWCLHCSSHFLHLLESDSHADPFAIDYTPAQLKLLFVCLDVNERWVSFYDAKTWKHLHTFTDMVFSDGEKIYPVFCSKDSNEDIKISTI